VSFVVIEPAGIKITEADIFVPVYPTAETSHLGKKQKQIRRKKTMGPQ
jgi:hypothetical protein